MGGGMGGAGSGFLRSAAATAAGVAGGALLFQGISSLFGNHYAGGLMSGGMTPGLGETVVNNYYGSDPQSGSMPADDRGGYDPGNQQDASFQDDSGTDMASDDSGDFGGSDFGGWRRVGTCRE